MCVKLVALRINRYTRRGGGNAVWKEIVCWSIQRVQARLRWQNSCSWARLGCNICWVAVERALCNRPSFSQDNICCADSSAVKKLSGKRRIRFRMTTTFATDDSGCAQVCVERTGWNCNVLMCWSKLLIQRSRTSYLNENTLLNYFN